MAISVLRNADTGAEVADRVRMADNFWTRFRGLMLAAPLEPGEALAFRPGGTIHMMFMRFALDVVFCDADGAVLKVGRDVKPWIGISTAPRRTKLMIEMAAGAAAELQPGVRLELVPRADAS